MSVRARPPQRRRHQRGRARPSGRSNLRTVLVFLILAAWAGVPVVLSSSRHVALDVFGMAALVLAAAATAAEDRRRHGPWWDGRSAGSRPR